jgi:competence protein ComK
MIYMFGEYDRYGKLCAIVFEEEQTFVVDKSPLEVVKESIEFIGSDFNGALAGSKKILGKRRMCPVMVNYLRDICVFPDRGYKIPECIWINSKHILNTSAIDRMTLIEFSNGSNILVSSRLAAFNTKVQTAEQYRKMTYERGMNSKTVMLDPKKRLLKQRK